MSEGICGVSASLVSPQSTSIPDAGILIQAGQRYCSQILKFHRRAMRSTQRRKVGSERLVSASGDPRNVRDIQADDADGHGECP